MRRLNAYARARGIHLYFGGYGASYGMAYEPVVMYENGSDLKVRFSKTVAVIPMVRFTVHGISESAPRL